MHCLLSALFSQKIKMLAIYKLQSNFLFSFSFMQRIEELTKKNTANNYTAKHLDQKVLTLNHIKRMSTLKVMPLSQDMLTKLDNNEKFLRYVKKQVKDQRLNQFQLSTLCQGYLEELDDFIRNCFWQFRLHRTDFQSLFIKLKYSQEKKKQKTDLQDIISYQTKKQGSYLLKSKDNVLLELRNQFQDFQLSGLIAKSTNILQNMPYGLSLNPDQKKCLNSIVKEIARNYNIMPFHNFTHGFSVSTSFYCLMQLDGLKGLIDDLELLFCVIACLAHDIQHQGLNTLFQVKTNSQLSIDFGKFTVMEKMHLSRILEILIKKQETKFLFESLNAQQRTKARKIISRAILATDMSKHYQYVSFVSEKKANLTLADDKYTVVQALVHACDIENPSLDFKSYMYWAHLVCIQFHDQTVKEKEWNVEVTDFLKFDSLSYFFKNQSNFAGTIVYPLWYALEELFPSIKSKELSQKIKKNISVLLEALRRNSEPVLLHKPFQQYLTEQLQD